MLAGWCVGPSLAAVRACLKREALTLGSAGFWGLMSAGRRKFSDFASQYVEAVPGHYIDIDVPSSAAPCDNILAVTHGQRAAIGGLLHR